MKQQFSIKLRLCFFLLSLTIISCSEDAGIAIDKSLLEEKVEEATSILTASQEGDAVGQFQSGSKDELSAAIDEAQLVLQDEEAIQTIVNSAYQSLDTAIDQFRRKGNFEVLTNWEFIRDLTGDELYDLVQSDEPDIFSIIDGATLKDVKIYKIEYQTNHVDGTSVVASGAILYADHDASHPLASFQHGTIFTQDDAPSKFNTERLSAVFGAVLAGSGYAVAMPDYLGFGSSSQVPHPYEHGKTLGSASFDMLRAAKEFYAVHQQTLSSKLFITGYSEGGYATMALHQHIEAHSDWQVTMSAPAAGAYNKSAFFKEMMSMTADYDFPGSPMWVVDAYDWIYDFNKDWDEYLNEPYATTMKGISNPFDFISADLAKSPEKLYTESYRSSIAEGTDATYLAAIAANDFFDWSPKAPITLYYGTKDSWVFPLNSTSAYEAIMANGGEIEIVAYQGEDHFTSSNIYVRDVFELFESLR
ncbi:prolyl oligopeptidase family serine peptidase [Reichenbachiella sp.]|uniref:prolyl oligopeptidase family serine peptidase n=1 Tax=Reichenbachiella sp. TaxID=2184521 RepID=UPI003B5AAB56